MGSVSKHPAEVVDDPVTYLHLDDVDLTNCDREQLHVLGTTQPHGVLLVVDDEGRVVVASANAPSFLGVDGPVQGEAVSSLLEDRPGSMPVSELLQRATGRARLGQAVLMNGDRVDVVSHRMQGHVFLELEPAMRDDISVLLSDVGAAIAALPSNAPLADAFEVAAAAVRQITGFDRVMIYEFHEDGHGEVVAENRRPDLEPFLGLHYPAADVPKQARLLYVRNWTRLIADVAADPAPLVPQTLPSGAPVNLAQAQLRAVSPIHLEYLRNMGVAASLSLSLVDDGELVGLIACHATSPRRVPFAARAAAELMARLVSEQFARARAAEQAVAAQDRRRAQIAVLRRVAEARGPAAALKAIGADTIELLEAAAFVGRIGDEVCEIGDRPPATELVEALLASKNGGSGVAIDDIMQWDAGKAGEFDGGVLAVPLGDKGFLAWRRSSVVRTISWGGDPSENVEPDGERLTPRGSFDVWMETMASACAPWTPKDRQLAESLRRTLDAEPDAEDGYRVVEALTAYTEELEAANEALRASVTQREEIVAAVAHDLRGPMRTLSALTEALVARVGDDAGLQQIGARITGNARRLEESLDGIQQWARLDDALAPADVDLGQAVDTVLEALRHQLDEVRADVAVGELPHVLGDPVLIRQALQNIVENAIRYRDEVRPLRITFTTNIEEDGIVIHVEDNGIGIPVENQDEVFGMFRRVPGVDRGGTGMGLALVRRVAQAHGGTAWLDSTVGVGTAIHLRLPSADQRAWS